MIDSPSEALAAAERRGWRVVLMLAAGLYLVGSHWPRLEMDPVGSDGPSPDKILHFITYFLLSLPAWWTGWFPTLGRLWIAGMLFAAFDEVTQWLLPIDRSITVSDLVCDACGLTAAVAVLAASRPSTDPRSRRRAAQRRIAEAVLLARPSNWMVLGATSALGVVVLVPLAVIASEALRIEARAMAVAGIAIGAATAGLVGLEFGVHASMRRLRSASACLHCGAPGGTTSLCTVCSTPRDPTAWFDPPGVPAATWLDAVWWPMIRAGVVAAAAILLLGAIEIDRRWFSGESTVARVVDVAVAIVVLSWGVHGSRLRLAAISSGADRRCIRCGHDLRGLQGERKERSEPIPCPECGVAFIREPMSPAVAADSTPETNRETMSR